MHWVNSLSILVCLVIVKTFVSQCHAAACELSRIGLSSIGLSSRLNWDKCAIGYVFIAVCSTDYAAVSHEEPLLFKHQWKYFYVLEGSKKKKKKEVSCSELVKFQFAAKLPYQVQATWNGFVMEMLNHSGWWKCFYLSLIHARCLFFCFQCHSVEALVQLQPGLLSGKCRWDELGCSICRMTWACVWVFGKWG